MSVVHSYDVEEIKISDCESILLEEKGEDGYRWVEVTFKSKKEQIFIGSYSTYSYGLSRGWMKHNTHTIAIAKEYIPSYCVDGVIVETIFDINTKLFIEGNQADLLDYYNQQFGDKKQDKENAVFPKLLLVKKQER